MYLILLFKSKSLNFKIVMNRKVIVVVLEAAKYIISALLGYLTGASL